MTNNKEKKRNIKAGQVFLVSTFAGIDVKIKATRKEYCGWSQRNVWYGVLIDEADAVALQKASVPYSKINVDESFIFEWQIVKLIRKPRQKRGKDGSIIRKRRQTKNAI